MGETGLEFGVLGPLQLSVDGTPLPLGAPKQRAVLAMLVINRNRPVGVESLINAVWDNRPCRQREPASIPIYPTCAASSATPESTRTRC